MRPTVLLLLPTTSYRAADLLAAAAAQQIDVIVASDRQQALETTTGGTSATVPFTDVESALRRIGEIHEHRPLAAVLGLDDETTIIAAAACERLGLRYNPVASVARLSDKLALRCLQREHGLPHPAFAVISPVAAVPEAAPPPGFPCVLKPTFLSASRGVIRADDPDSFVQARRRIEAILSRPEVVERRGDLPRRILAESFVPGPEVAFEGLLTGGHLRTLALFDKPDPLDGPFFEETLYVTPSRLPTRIQNAVRAAVAAVLAAAGLREGPVHAELRLAQDGPIVIEAAPRSIGGLCGRTLRFASGMALEEIILRHAIGRDIDAVRECQAAAVMMLPIARAGTLRAVRGQAAARAVDGIVELVISLRPGQAVEPLPEGNRYLGFLFARAPHPEAAEAALRAAHSRLEVIID